MDTRATRVHHLGAPTSPVLIVGGSALGPDSLEGPRVLLLPDALELGRQDAPAYGWPLMDLEVSRRHAQIVKTDGGYQLVDFDSTNGTYVNGARIRGAHPLHDGSIITVGPYVFVFRYLPKAALAAITEDLAVPFGPVATASADVAIVLRRLRLLARTSLDLLLTGDTGVGKEVYSRAIHRVSGRKGDLVAINCAAIPDNLVESELFGYAKGAHSTANDAKTGLLEAANGGTLFLDEIGDMPVAAQSKLLRFLQDRRFVPLGCTRPRHVDTRILAATRRGLATDDKEQGLRLDLAARLGPEALRIPNLRARMEDIGGLVWFFLGSARKPFTSDAFTALFLHDWPGNVRELEKTISLAVAVSASEERIGLEHLPRRIVERAVGSDAPPVNTNAAESRAAAPSREVLESLLRQHGGDVARVARQLGRQRTLVWRWLRKYGCEPSQYRDW